MAISKVKLSDNNINYTKTINDNFSDLSTYKVDKVDGKDLSTEDFTTALKTKLEGIETGAEVNIIEEVKVNGTALTPDANKSVNIVIPSASEYTIVEQAQAETGYAKTYYLTKDNVQQGAKINIPKDLVVESGEVKTVTVTDEPYTGAVIGDKYIDLIIANASSSHIYIPVKDLVDVYTAGNGIEVSNANVISAKIDTTNANGLAVTSSGLKLNVATATVGQTPAKAGAMSGTDKDKLDGIETGAETNVIETVKVNGTALTPDGNKAVDITIPNSTYIQSTTFTSSDAGWSSVDANGNYTLTIANTGVPVMVKKSASPSGYETCMVNIRNDGTNFYITADDKFSGIVYYFA